MKQKCMSETCKYIAAIFTSGCLVLYVFLAYDGPGVHPRTVYPKKYAHGFVVLCFVVVMQSFIMNSHEVFLHIHQGCFAGTGAIVRLPQCQWSKPDGYGKISQCITTTKHSKAKTVCIFLGIYCISWRERRYIEAGTGHLDEVDTNCFINSLILARCGSDFIKIFFKIFYELVS